MFIFLILVFFVSNCSANVLQYFTGISYSNPSELFKVKKNEFLLGASGIYGDIVFKGSVLNLNTRQYDSGVSASRRFSFLPYGRIAHRVNDKLVLGVDVTQPYHSNLVWGLDNFTRYASVATLMTDIDVSPRFSYKLFSKLTVGAGLNFNFLINNEVDWALPINSVDYANLINRSSSFGLGYDLGLYFTINKNNFLAGTRYSSIRQTTRGQSIFNEAISNDLYFNFRMPSTTILNYVHLFNKKWLGSVQVFCSEWNANQFARVRNTAVPPPIGPSFNFEMRYRPAWAYSAYLRKQQSENLGIAVIGLIDVGPERDHLRTINFPSDVQYFIALTTDYHLSKTLTAELLYGHVFSNPPLGNFITIEHRKVPFTFGKVRINAEVFELRIKLQT